MFIHAVDQRLEVIVDTETGNKDNHKTEEEEETAAIYAISNMVSGRQMSEDGIYVCDSTFTANDALNRHKESKHKDIRYGCDQCIFVATSQGKLNKHKKIKHKEVQYYCDQCDYKASRQASLISHNESKGVFW